MKLSHGISNPSLLNKYKDSLLYCVVEKPCHGRVGTLTTTNDTLIYTPHVGYVGSDFFTYKLQLASLSTSTVTISIDIREETDLDDIELGEVHHADTEGKNADDDSDDSSEQEMRSVKKGKVELTSNVKRKLQEEAIEDNKKRIEELFSIKGAAGSYGLKDRFQLPNANLGARARISSASRIRDISPRRGINGGYQQQPTFASIKGKLQGATSSADKTGRGVV